MKVFLIADYDHNDRCKIHSVYLHKEKAEERVEHLYRQQDSNRIGYHHTYHVLKKTLKGNIKKAIKKGLIK